MKKFIPTIVQIATYFGLPASFVAAALHEIVPQTASSGQLAIIQPADFLAPVLFVSTVMSVAFIIVHHLREEARLVHFTNLHLRFSPLVKNVVAACGKARLANASAC